MSDKLNGNVAFVSRGEGFKNFKSFVENKLKNKEYMDNVIRMKDKVYSEDYVWNELEHRNLLNKTNALRASYKLLIEEINSKKFN